MNADEVALVAEAIAEEFDIKLDGLLPNSEFMDFIMAARAAIRKYEEIKSKERKIE